MSSLAEELKQRNVSEAVNINEEMPAAGRILKNTVTGAQQGYVNSLKGMTRGVGSFLTGNEDIKEPTEEELAYEKARENATSLEGILYDTAYGVGNMAPSIVLGAATGPLGAAASKAASLGSMTLGIVGNTYEDTIREGYGTDESRKYALASGISEGATEYILGGIAGVSGRFLSKAFGNKIGSLATGAAKEGLAKYAREYGLDMLSEGTQEYAQELLDKATRNFILGENNQLSLTDPDAWYSALLGATTAGILNIPNTAARVSYDRELKRYADSGGIGTETSYRDMAEAIDTDASAYTDTEGNINDEALKQAENVKRMAEELAVKEENGQRVSTLERAELQGETDKLMELAQTMSDTSSKNDNSVGKTEQSEIPAAEINTNDKEPAINIPSSKELNNDTALEEISENQPLESENTELHRTMPPDEIRNEGFDDSTPLRKSADNELSDANKQLFPQYVNEFSTKLSETATEKMVESYDGSVPMEKYLSAYKRMYTAGRNNIPQSTAERTALRTYLTSEQITEAYKLGAQDRYAALQNKPGYEQGAAREGGLEYASGLSTDAQRKVAEHIGRKTGLKIRIDENIIGQAEYNSTEGVITVSPNSDNFNQSLSHELTHFIQDYDKKSYEGFKKTAIEALMKSENINYDQLVERYERAYLDSGTTPTIDELTDEIAADAAGRFLNDEEFIDSIIKKDRTLAEKIRDFFEDIADALKTLIDTGSIREAAKALRENEAMYRTAAGLWNNGLTKASESHRSGNTLKESSQDSRFSLKELDNGRGYVEVDTEQQRFDGMEPKEQLKEAARVIREKFAGKTFGYESNLVTANGRTAKEYKGKHYPPEIMEAKARLSPELDNLIAVSEYIGHSDDKGYHHDAVGGWDYYRGIFNVNGKFYTGDINVMNRAEDRLLYDVYKINEAPNLNQTSVAAPLLSATGDGRSDTNSASSESNISYTGAKIKKQLDLGEPVEETKDLIAVHNLTEKKLEQLLDYEGIPMPSIAVIKADIGHTNFGDISLVFGKDTVDPSNRKNKVYSADAWTPTFPRIEYNIDRDKAYSVVREVEKLADNISYSDYADEARRFVAGLDNQLNTLGGEEALINAAMENTGMKAAYLSSLGEDIKEITHIETSELPAATQKAYDAVLNELGDEFEKLQKLPQKQFAERLTKAYEKGLVAAGVAADSARKRTEKFSKPLLLSSLYKHIADYKKHGGVKTKTVTDSVEMNRLLDKKVREKGGMREWTEELLHGLEAGQGVWNGKNLYTSSGEKRSFSQMHYPVTAENIVRSMLNQAEDVRNVVGYLGAKSVRAVIAEDFADIEAMHRAESKIKNISPEEFENMEGDINDRLNKILVDIINRKNTDNIMAIDQIGNCILDAARTDTSAYNIEKILKKYNWPVTENEAKKISAILEEIKDMPVNMFEAKPQRVVDFSEVVKAVIPDTTDLSLKDKIASKGIDILEYPVGDQESRKRAVANINGIRFQLDLGEDNSVDNKALIEQNNTLKQANEYLISQLTSGKKYIPSRTDISKIAGELIKETDSHYSKDVLTDKLTTLYSYIHDSDYIDGAELSSVAADLAGEILSRSGAGYDEYQIKAYNDLTSYLRKTNIKIPEGYKGDFDVYGGYNEFRKKYFGTINLRSNGQTVDQVYSELSDRFPEYFSPDIINPADQVIAIADAIEAIRPAPINLKMPEADYREQSYLLGQEIYQKYFDVKFKEGNGTSADKDLYSKYSASIRKYKTQLRQQYRESFLEVKKKSDAKIKELSNRYKTASQEEKANLRAKMDALRSDKNQRLYIQQEKYRKKISDTRDFYKGQRYKSMIIKDVTELGKWLSEPTDKRHVPDMLRKPLAEFLSDIDFSSNNLNQQGEPTQRTVKWQNLQATYARILQNDGIVEGDNGSQYIDIDPDIVERMGELVKAVENIDKLDNLDAYTLEELKNVVQSMKHSITDANRMIENKRYENVAEIANKSIGELSNLKDRSRNAGTVVETSDRLLNNKMLDSYTRFYTFGPAAQTIYSELREGFNRKIKNTQEAENYIEKLKKDNNITTKDIQRWSGINAETIKYKTDRGEEIELKPSQVMSLYALMQRGQARKHILQGGVRPARTKIRKKINRFTIREIDISTSKNIRLTQNDVVKLVDKLSPEQKAIADGITKFFTNVTSRWGNEVSNKMYGYTKFNAKNYFPIVSDKSFITTKTEDLGKTMQSLKNMGFTKSTTPGAANPLILEDIFDVYTRQADQMGSYNAFVIPLSDMQKWYNYKLKGYEGSVKQEIERVFGNDAVEYIKKLMEDINGVGGNDQYFAAPLVSKFKASAVGFNLRVAIQQPTAYVRAAAEINPKYLISGLRRIPEKGKWELIKKYSPIAQWKDWGFFETSTGRSMKNILLGNQSFSENLRDKQMWLAGKGDEVTWIRLWQATEEEVKDKNRELTPGTDAFYEKVGERFDQIIDSTQVIDSVLHRSDIMRSSNDLNKMITAFMSEPTKSYNMIYRSYFDFLRSDKKNKAKAAKKIGKTAMIFTLSSAATAAASAVISAMRDDEDKKYSEKYAEAFVDDFVGNVNPANMIPVIKDIGSIFEGYDVSRSDMTAVQEFKWAIDKLKKIVKGESTETIPSLIVYSLKPISSITGIAFDNLVRDFDAFWDTFISGLLPADVEYAKIRTFDADLGNTRNLSIYVPMILDAYKNGNDDLAERIISDLEENDIAREKIEEKISSMLSADERIEEAAQALADKNTDKYESLREELISEGYDSELVETKIHNKLDSLKPYTYTEIAAAADSPEEFGRMADEILKYKIAEGQTEDDIVSNIRKQVTQRYKPMYVEAYKNRDEAAMRDMREKLGSLKVYGKKLYGANYNFSKEWLD
ncbi:MAG: hypothetical protein ACOYBV_04575 [Candidatus Avilachnospira sp.]